MVKFLKQSIAVFLSCSMLFCNVSGCFGVGPNDINFSDEDIPRTYEEEEVNPKHVEEGSSTTDSKEQLKRDFGYDHKPLPLLLLGGQNKGQEMDRRLTRSYVSRRIQSADVARLLHDEDNSIITVPIGEFFLCPPRSAKELFETKDKEAAIAYKDAILHTDVVRSVENGECCKNSKYCKCCNSCCRCPELGCGVVSIVVSTSALILSAVIAMYYGICWKVLNDYTTDYTEVCGVNTANEQECKDAIESWRVAIILSAFVFIITGISSCTKYSKACCGCYLCKPSHYGCSCGYGCCNDGDECVGCIGCIDSCNCCSYDGCTLDFCGSYGSGGCCMEPVYQKFSKDSITSVADFKKFIKSLNYYEKNFLYIKGTENINFSLLKGYLTSSSIRFERCKDRCEINTPENNIDGAHLGAIYLEVCGVIPDLARSIFTLFNNNNKHPDEKNPDWKQFIAYCKAKGIDGNLSNVSNLSSFIDTLYTNIEQKSDADKSLVDKILPSFEFQLEARKSTLKNQVEKLIVVTLELCNCALQDGELNVFEQVKLTNCFNFLEALWDIHVNG